MPHESLTDAQIERLEMLIEECGEIITASTKILRHGYSSHHPNRSESNNALELEHEVLDVVSVLSAMGAAGDLRVEDQKGFYSPAAQERWDTKLRYTHHQEIGR